ncbi:hypothetical protein ACHAPQ_008538 [Fusarium lateritium]
MGAISTRNIPKENVFSLDDATVPDNGTQPGGEITSAIYKEERQGPTFVTATGILGNKHAANTHGGTERAVHQYNPDHYPDWQSEKAPEPKLYDVGAFGENLVTTNTKDDNVCAGDIFKLGNDALLEVSKPRNPSHELNSRLSPPTLATQST